MGKFAKGGALPPYQEHKYNNKMAKLNDGGWMDAGHMSGTLLVSSGVLKNTGPDPWSTYRLTLRLPSVIDSLTDVEVLCPESECQPLTSLDLWEAIQHLNDDHLWTREAIADWLDGLHGKGGIDLSFPVPEEG